ncbi:NAD(P)/FAD-dependent oxidoreductase [Celeribacter halophilus]|uniref:NAD(P)/FAD-dependent oxidoreductase n=1 Tax=Celeribacter halophilus TaxID=576117 RepID=UPI001C09720D|nr:NAD(P)/FAD-dependent oxidoreductase [Celeribacter halophilus]MBU2890564.1 NAD(P)/FAD-dependent oxidoreductase [Celeribacter halophilus]MDO6510272.1 NAD(P)/FAD-dependent oxidoreductase [Celeribacter halophilus]
MTQVDTLILGAGAAGLFCAKFAAATGGSVLVVDHAKRPADKVRISGGGRCNFTNLYAAPDNYICRNPHFMKSALARYTQWDFIDLLAQHGITWHEKNPEKGLGQLFCDGKSAAIIEMLLHESRAADLRLSTEVGEISHDGTRFTVFLNGQPVQARNLVVATGGKSIPKMGASGIGYQIATQFGLQVLDTRPGLVPLTFAPHELEWIAPLAGTAIEARVTANGTSFDEALLFTHRGLSGPAILQVSNYWREGDAITVDLLPAQNAFEALKAERSHNGRRQMHTALATLFPAKLATALTEKWHLRGNLADQSDKALQDLANHIHALPLKPTGSEGYRTAEVTLGGVDTDGLSSKTMEAKTVPGLYFIGEVVDVTGWLGGYNFQWAWASAAAAGRAIAERQ